MDEREIRLEIIKALLPHCSQSDVEESNKLIAKAKQIESFVLDSSAKKVSLKNKK